VLLALDLDDGCHLGLAETDDFESLDWRGIVSAAGVRNGVLFPRKIGGRYVRLERPNDIVTQGIAASGTAIVVSSSSDLLHWQHEGLLARGRPHYWDEWIGSGPPPILTAAGWLHVYHGVATHFGSLNIYQAGAMLLDADDPTRLLARSRNNCLEPRESYELTGQVPNVVFPSGWTVSELDARGRAPAHATIHLYYGAADSCVALATTTVAELLAMCED
jgi:beta-1,4-mannooligosaccharide/beta-1,4-mannosyl-N-acetylglucosamine phosphorylase